MARRKKGPSPRGRGRPVNVRRKRKSRFREQAKCRFCRQKVEEVDYKDVPTLVKLTTQQGKIFSRKRSGNCARHQRSCMRAIKRARLLALLPYVS
ncbi:MAG: 30S ribosomal protein S18 [Phycisphaerae bacterium]